MTHPKAPAAWPYWITLSFVPLVVLAVLNGGWWIALIPLWGWGVMPLLDLVFGRDLSNPDPDTPDADLFWFRLLTWIWFPIEAVLVFMTIWYLTQVSAALVLEKLAVTFGIGVTTGTVGIVYAHELFHKANRAERWLGDLLLAMVLYSHFRTEHLLVHHPHVGTPRDTVTARYNEGFLRFFPRVLVQGPRSALRAERALLRRAGRSAWDRRNPFWRYAALQGAALGLAYALGGWAGVGLFAFQALVAVWQLELTNYVEHYGLTRRHLGGGRYEPVGPQHSWDSTHRVSNLLLINLQRHADHHLHPMRRFPLLQFYDAAQVPQLPTGYPPMTALAMIPPFWRRLMNPKVRAWRKRHYPDITDWAAYKAGTLPVPEGAVIRATVSPITDKSLCLVGPEGLSISSGINRLRWRHVYSLPLKTLAKIPVWRTFLDMPGAWHERRGRQPPAHLGQRGGGASPRDRPARQRHGREGIAGRCGAIRSKGACQARRLGWLAGRGWH
ncbi:alkane 1-monooxygenase [Roseovarius sp. MBR-78]|uniref:alkane 1-monooxygenase n=1 Tax=Roseovarius sp. MBR-78 TaxID=3156460 RepID=UPI00339921CD